MSAEDERAAKYAEVIDNETHHLIVDGQQWLEDVARAVMAVADAEQAEKCCEVEDDLKAELRAAGAEVERQASLLRAINDCHRDPARAILQADRIAGAAILRAEAAERDLAVERARVARIEVLADSLDILARLPIEERPDGLTATQKACGALAGDLRAVLADPDAQNGSGRPVTPAPSTDTAAELRDPPDTTWLDQ